MTARGATPSGPCWSGASGRNVSLHHLLRFVPPPLGALRTWGVRAREPLGTSKGGFAKLQDLARCVLTPWRCAVSSSHLQRLHTAKTALRNSEIHSALQTRAASDISSSGRLQVCKSDPLRGHLREEAAAHPVLDHLACRRLGAPAHDSAGRGDDMHRVTPRTRTSRLHATPLLYHQSDRTEIHGCLNQDPALQAAEAPPRSLPEVSDADAARGGSRIYLCVRMCSSVLEHAVPFRSRASSRNPADAR